MTASTSRLTSCCCCLLLLLVLFSINCSNGQVQIDEVAVSSSNVPRDAVSQLLIQSALNSLNEHSPSRNTYKNSQLIQAQKLVRCYTFTRKNSYCSVCF